MQLTLNKENQYISSTHKYEFFINVEVRTFCTKSYVNSDVDITYNLYENEGVYLVTMGFIEQSS